MDIRHVVVLMLENRSFDCMLGMLYQNSEQFAGLIGTEFNTWHKPDGSRQDIQVWKDPALTALTVCIPDPDPGELSACRSAPSCAPARRDVRKRRDADGTYNPKNPGFPQ